MTSRAKVPYVIIWDLCDMQFLVNNIDWHLSSLCDLQNICTNHLMWFVNIVSFKIELWNELDVHTFQLIQNWDIFNWLTVNWKYSLNIFNYIGKKLIKILHFLLSTSIIYLKKIAIFFIIFKYHYFLGLYYYLTVYFLMLLENNIIYLFTNCLMKLALAE